MKCQCTRYNPSEERECHAEQYQHKDVGGVVKVRPDLCGRDVWRLGPFCRLYCIALPNFFESGCRCTVHWCSTLVLYRLYESVMIAEVGGY
jgi:hypothetical protein